MKLEVGNKKRSTLTADFGYDRRHCGSNSCAYFMQFTQIDFFLEASTEGFGGITCPSMQRFFYLNWSHGAHSYMWQMLYIENASVWHTGFKWQHFKIEQNKMRIWFLLYFNPNVLTLCWMYSKSFITFLKNTKPTKFEIAKCPQNSSCLCVDYSVRECMWKDVITVNTDTSHTSIYRKHNSHRY